MFSNKWKKKYEELLKISEDQAEIIYKKVPVNFLLDDFVVQHRTMMKVDTWHTLSMRVKFNRDGSLDITEHYLGTDRPEGVTYFDGSSLEAKNSGWES